MDHDTLTVKVVALTAIVQKLQRQLNNATALLIELCIDFYDEGDEDDQENPTKDDSYLYRRKDNATTI